MPTTINTANSTAITTTTGLTSTYTVPMTASAAYGANNIAAGQASNWSRATIGSMSVGQIMQSNASSVTWAVPQPSNIIAFHDLNNKPIVTLALDGSVTWAKEIDIDEAATAFARSLTLAAEMKSSITNGVKVKMRDTVFEEIIALAKIKGSLTVDELTLMYESCKIMEKLKGSNGL